MLYLLTAVMAQMPAEAPRTIRLADCRPVLTLASATNAAQRRDDARPKRPKPCMVMASA